MSHKHILYSLIVLLILCFTCLAYIEKVAKDSNDNKNWWALSFKNPQDTSLDFTIENHSDETDFTYEITQPEKEKLERTVHVFKGDIKEISVSASAPEGRTRITVWTRDTDKKEINK